MKTNLKYFVGLAAIACLLTQNAQAAKYELCITCSGGGPYQVGSPTPNPGGNYLTAFCASKGAGTPLNLSLAQKIAGKYRCIGKAVKIDGIKKIQLVDPVLDPVGVDGVTDAVKSNLE